MTMEHLIIKDELEFQIHFKYCVSIVQYTIGHCVSEWRSHFLHNTENSGKQQSEGENSSMENCHDMATKAYYSELN